MAKVTVIVPRGGSCPYRERAWQYLRTLWARHYPDMEVVEGWCHGDVWCKAEAVADALPRARGDILVVADADVWVPGIAEAVRQLEQYSWAVPHWLVYRLTEEASRPDRIEREGWDGPTVERPYVGYEGGGMVVLPRDLYVDAPLDPRFRGWGQEDEAWALALRTIGGPPWRGTAPLYHLWHPPQARLSRRFGSSESIALFDLYRVAAGHREAMDQVLAEPRAAAQMARIGARTRSSYVVAR